jgi:protein SCO1
MPKKPSQLIRLVAMSVLTVFVCASPVLAQVGQTAPAPGTAASEKPSVLSKVKIDQLLDRQIPLDLPFKDETGRDVRLGEYFGKRPVLLSLVYYECPMLCTQNLNGLVTALGVMNFEPGREFEVVIVSFNPREGPGLASQKKAAYMERYARPHTAGAWHFLTGTEASIKQLTEAVGFHYEYDAAIQQFAHGPAIQVLTPKGRISKYFYGIEYSARDIRLGVIEASEERIGSPIDTFLLLCYHYDPATGKYGAAVLRMIRLGGIATVLAFLCFLGVSLRRERMARFNRAAISGIGPAGGAFSPPDGGAHRAPARERSGALGPRERPSRGSGWNPD